MVGDSSGQQDNCRFCPPGPHSSVGSRGAETAPGEMLTADEKVEGAWQPLMRPDGGLLARRLGENSL